MPLQGYPPDMSALTQVLNHFRHISETEREKGTYFEELTRLFLSYEPAYADLYEEVWAYADWVKEVGHEYGHDAKDTGIDLVAKTRGLGEFHAIQCKFFNDNYKVAKRDIDSFFTASGQAPFCHRIIVTTTNHWGDNAEKALQNQNPPVTKIDRHDLEHSIIDWEKFQPNAGPVLKQKYDPKPHQVTIIDNALKALDSADRGKLIMACGTGKTFTSLKIAEQQVGAGGSVLFLVPSLALLSQTLTEWTQQSRTPLHSFAVCSDSDVGKKKNDDLIKSLTHELRFPATTNPKSLSTAIRRRHDAQHMSVIFSTYHSIEVLSQAQKDFGLADFDLIICDEAHRTTGATFVGEDESNFVKVHQQDFLRAAKRIYMTATPRIYGESSKAKADTEGVALCSMDDKEMYGDILDRITFSSAVEQGLLCDYKVVVLTIGEGHISKFLSSRKGDSTFQIKVDDAARIVGCWKALAKEGLTSEDPSPMRRAVAFCQVIEAEYKGKKHKVSSKKIASMFQSVVDAYQDEYGQGSALACQAEHVDGTMNASEKSAKINWLKEEAGEDTCRILSNVRCLSEGVDVPALDAVLFLTPRNSQIDVVQSVGRVMRTSPGKKRGYVILPVVIPESMEPHEALNDNTTYKVVWDVLQALRSHDDRFDSHINKWEFDGINRNVMEVVAVTDKLTKKSKSTGKKYSGKGQHAIGVVADSKGPYGNKQLTLDFIPGEVEQALYAKIVKKCGSRRHWEDWAKDIAKIAQTHITRITAIVHDKKHKDEGLAFQEFVQELRDDLNESISEGEVIEMLAQHLITKPVFDALFQEFSFASNNPVSKAMQEVLDLLHEHHLESEADTLGKFYEDVKRRAAQVQTATGKQKIVVELYDKFFRTAFPKMTERLGIVYTPVEIVDFIIHSVNDLLKQDFGTHLGGKGVHILDPFTGTGTFITRLLQSGLIKPEELPHKYRHEIHCNEIVLLAYYIAAINIEAVYHALVGGDYTPFEGICLTDTFQLHESEDLISHRLISNSDRRKKQKELDIRVIMGNPPYSVGQSSENDNNQNLAYEGLDERIAATYAKKSNATLQKGLYDSYIRAIRWASDRVGDSGIIGFVTNAGFLETKGADGLRKCLAEEFSNIYVFHLKGNARTSGKRRRKEKDNVFGQGTRTPVAITLLVKNPDAKQHGQIHWHYVDDYLTQREKLDVVHHFKSVSGITKEDGWTPITPDKYGDWVNQRDDSFDEFIKAGDKKGADSAIFENYSQGILTARDAWCYNTSKAKLDANMSRMVSTYSEELERYQEACVRMDKKPDVADIVVSDPTQISWTANLKSDVKRGKSASFNNERIRQSLYRPFMHQWAYVDRQFNERVYQMPKIFPDEQAKNLVICVTGIGESKGFAALMAASVPNYHFIAGGQCFPLYLYEDSTPVDDSLFFTEMRADRKGGRRDAISDAGLRHFTDFYPGETITKEDLFYYIYGLLHSEEYRTRYADNLSKELPRIPRVKKTTDFWHFSQAGRQLADLHIGYEDQSIYPATLDYGKRKAADLTDDDYRVQKMKFVKKGAKTAVKYNDLITIKDIPMEAYDYVVNGRSALEWVIDRQQVKTDKASGIVNDPNDWATETMNNPKYPLELFLRIITVSLETVQFVNNLPKLELEGE